MYEAAKHHRTWTTWCSKCTRATTRARALRIARLHRGSPMVTPAPGTRRFVADPLFLLRGVIEALHGIHHGARTVLVARDPRLVGGGRRPTRPQIGTTDVRHAVGRRILGPPGMPRPML